MGKVEGLIWLLGVPAMLQVKLWNSRGAFYHLAFMGNYYKHVLTISAQQMISFEETMMWGPFKISSGWLCVWCESKEIGCGTGAKIPSTNGGESSADFLPTMESY